jgi:DNA-directed RNA polymerase subunit M/transcription elongation factor TFIIS
MKDANISWESAIAKRAGTDVSRVRAVLARHRITAAPVLPSPRRLTLIRISFSGVKDKAGSEGPFEFDWSNLQHGIWALLTDENLRGKSSVLEVVHWLLRGRQTGNLQEDIRRWIHMATVGFLLDGVEHEIRVDSRGGVHGTLSCIDRKGKRPSQLAKFEDEEEFEAAMSDFFMRAFSMDAITSWQSAAPKDEDVGHAVSHGWAAFSGAMFIGTNYETLLGDLPFGAGLNSRLITMYLGVPWVSTLAASQSALKGVQSAIESSSRKSARDNESRQQRQTELEAELESKRAALAAIPSDEELRNSLAILSTEYARVQREMRTAERRIANEREASEQARNLYTADRKELQTHQESMAAGAIFRQLDPTFCPRCDTAISADKKKLEQVTHACSVCGEHTQTDEDATVIQEELEKRAKASKSASDAAEKALGITQVTIDDLSSSSASLQARIELETARLGAFSRQQALALEVAVLEGRIAETGHRPTASDEDRTSGDLKTLDAAVAETDERVRAVRDDLLKEVSERIVYYAQRFGMHALEGATLRGNASLSLAKGGTNTSYSKVTEGEKLRLKVATILAMLEVGESKGVGRHPGLLMIDSPGAQEVSQADLEALISGLQAVSEEIAHCQVFVAARSSDAITQHVPDIRRREALGGGFLW